MKNLKIYILTILISLVLIAPSLFCKSTVTGVLSGIGCSGIAAAIMAVFIEISNCKSEYKKVNQAKALYFRQLYDQLIITVGKILWFDERVTDDSFDWNLQDNVYSSFYYMVEMSTHYPTSSLSYDEAIERLRGIGEKYSLEKIKTLDADVVYKVNRLFQIVAAGTSDLWIEANALKNDKLILEIEDYLSIEENKKIIFDISLALGLMHKKDKNYKVVIDFLISATDKLRKTGKYPANNIQIGLCGSVSVSEL